MQFLAKMNSRSCSLYAVIVRLSSVCLSVGNALVVIFSNISTAFGPWPPADNHIKFYGDRPRGTTPPGELNTTGVAKYSDFDMI